jgi:hypothetical protein
MSEDKCCSVAARRRTYHFNELICRSLLESLQDVWTVKRRLQPLSASRENGGCSGGSVAVGYDFTGSITLHQLRVKIAVAVVHNGC